MRVLIIVARRFNGHEFWTALKVINDAGVEFDVMSTALRISDEVNGQASSIKYTLDDSLWRVEDSYQGIMVVSGNPQDTMAFWTDDRVANYIDKAIQADAAIASICVGVPAIRAAVNRRKITCFPLVRSKELLLDAGAILTDVAVQTDGKICTAEHQMGSQMWAENFVAVMHGELPPNVLVSAPGFFRPSERRPIPEVEDLKRRQAGVKGPLTHDKCGYHTTIKNGRIMCPKCNEDLTQEDQ